MTKPLLPTPVAEHLSKKLRETKSRARLADFVEDLTDEFGGLRAVAAKMVKEFNDGKPGSIGRAKILAAYTQLLSVVNKKEDSTPVSELSDEVIDARMQEIAERALKSSFLDRKSVV